MIGRSFDEVSPECILIVESDNPEFSGSTLFKIMNNGVISG